MSQSKNEAFDQKLKEFGEEMIGDIRSLKDLTKAEMPELAKEYIRFNIIGNSIWMIISSIGLVAATVLAVIAYSTPPEDRPGWVISAFCIGIISLFSFAMGVSNLLEFIYMPRRKAIRAITSLFVT